MDNINTCVVRKRSISFEDFFLARFVRGICIWASKRPVDTTTFVSMLRNGTNQQVIESDAWSSKSLTTATLFVAFCRLRDADTASSDSSARENRRRVLGQQKFLGVLVAAGTRTPKNRSRTNIAHPPAKYLIIDRTRRVRDRETRVLCG